MERLQPLHLHLFIDLLSSNCRLWFTHSFVCSFWQKWLTFAKIPQRGKSSHCGKRECENLPPSFLIVKCSAFFVISKAEPCWGWKKNKEQKKLKTPGAWSGWCGQCVGQGRWTWPPDSDMAPIQFSKVAHSVQTTKELLTYRPIDPCTAQECHFPSCLCKSHHLFSQSEHSSVGETSWISQSERVVKNLQ